VAVLAAWPVAVAQAPDAQRHDPAALQEVVVTASRQADEALTAKVVQALQDNPYVFADHVSIETENGIVRVRGMVFDLSDLRRTLFLARRIAGKRRVVNELELIVDVECHD
jgi:osmotically-inducible protein OsmY